MSPVWYSLMIKYTSLHNTLSVLHHPAGYRHTQTLCLGGGGVSVLGWRLMVALPLSNKSLSACWTASSGDTPSITGDCACCVYEYNIASRQPWSKGTMQDGEFDFRLKLEFSLTVVTLLGVQKSSSVWFNSPVANLTLMKGERFKTC